MERTILERVKISLGQFRIEKIDDEMGESVSKTVYENEEENPILEELIQQNTDELLCKIEPPDRLIEKVKKKFESCIVELTKYDYVKIGGEYQASHSENGVSRTWNSKEEIYNFYKVNESGYVKIIG